MPLTEVLGHPYVTFDQYYADEHWREVSQFIRYHYGYDAIDDAKQVQEALDGIFALLLERFQAVIDAKGDLSFLMFVHRIHESSMLIADQIQKENPALRESLSEEDIIDVPRVRRVLKLVMEALLRPRFEEEVNEALKQTSGPTRRNVALLDELVYLGGYALEIAEHRSVSSIFKKATVLKSHRRKLLRMIVNSPYHQLFATVKENMRTYKTHHYPEVQDQLDGVLSQAFGVNLAGFQKSMQPALGSYIVARDLFVNAQLQEGGSEENLRQFYAGLTLSADNKLLLKDSFVKMQDNNRLTYRPIIEFQDKAGTVFWLMGFGKAFESIHALRTNAVLWGKLPAEWKANPLVKSFEREMEAYRESFMMQQIAGILEEAGVVYQSDVESLKDSRGQGFKITTDGLGQIDLIMLDEVGKVIYVCECKNNRPRFDMYNWKSDYDQFTSPTKKRNYETQLTRKVDWAQANKQRLQDHFNHLPDKSFDFTDWQVEGRFILMTPSIYKYDGLFPVLTVKDLVEFVRDGFSYSYGTLTFYRRNKSSYDIDYPYFKNINRMIDAGFL